MYFKKLLQSTDACVERKLILDASDGLQKAQVYVYLFNISLQCLLLFTSLLVIFLLFLGQMVIEVACSLDRKGGILIEAYWLHNSA